MDKKQVDRIKLYYEKLYERSGKKMPAGAGNVIESMTDSDRSALEEKISSLDPVYKRLMAYRKALSAYVAEPQTEYGNNKAADELLPAMEQVADNNDGYDSSKEHVITLNGNDFTYRDGFPIEKYKDYLSSLGDEEKGNRWDVSLDGEGRLVIY